MASGGGPSWWVKWTQWEYWPFWVFNTPVIMIWIWYGIRARALFFFSVVNPGIASGGMMGESKYNILQTISPKFYPKTLFIEASNADFSHIKELLHKSELDYPLVIKPNVGERGKRVEMIRNDGELKRYLATCAFDCLVQDYVDLPEEVAILYFRYPDQKSGHISSVCLKENLKVTGDGRRTIRELMEDSPRANFQIDRLLDGEIWTGEEIPDAGKEVLLEPIGNHSRGTKFMDGCHLINERLVRRMDEIHGDQDDVHYARYDLKYRDWESFLDGEDFAILEINGVSGEPAHMYDPKHSALYAYKTMYKQWAIMLRIAKTQRKKGYKPMKLSEAWDTFTEFNRHQKVLKAH